MNVQKISIERRQLNVRNYNKNYHIYNRPVLKPLKNK